MSTHTRTSKAAFRRIVDEGRDVSLRRRVAAQIGAEPSTLHELGDTVGADWNSYGPRVTELIRMGCVERRGTRPAPSGNDAYVHHLTPLGERYVLGEADPEMGPSVSEMQREVIAVARKYIRGEVDRDILELALTRHDDINRRMDPDWTPPGVDA